MPYETSSILTWLILLPIFGAAAVMVLPGSQVKAVRGVGMGFVLATCLLAIVAARMFAWDAGNGAYGSNVQLKQDALWINSLNVHYAVGVDGLSMPMVLLTAGMGVLAGLASLGIARNVKGYWALFLLLLAGLMGVFLAMDLLLFYLFLQVSLYPVFFLIGIWGSTKRESAAIKLFLFNCLGGVLMLAVILGIYFYVTKLPGHEEGTFNLITLATDGAITRLFSTGPGATFAGVAFWLLLLGFGLRFSLVPLHTWLTDAHSQAPTPVSMLLSALVLNTGAYGLMRVAYTIFPRQAADNWYWVALLAVIGILYASLCALGQKDFKRLVAYLNISGINYVLLGLAVIHPAGSNGAAFQMIALAISSAMMFFIVGVITDRAHHTDIQKLGGLAQQMPLYAGLSMIGFLALVGLPGLCGFVGIFMVLMGVFGAVNPDGIIMHATAGQAYKSLIVFGILAAAALILTAATLFSTWQRVFFGVPRPENNHFAALTFREKIILGVLAIAAISLGLLPGLLLLDKIRPTVDAMAALQR